MSRAAHRAFVAEMLAYVDQCLPPVAREAFERRMAASPDVRRQIEQWRWQNQAIKAAFAERAPAPTPATSGSVGRKGMVNTGLRRDVHNLREAAERRPSAGEPADRRFGIDRTPPPARVAAPKQRGHFRRLVIVVAAVVAAWIASGILSQRNPSASLVQTADDAYRTFAVNSLHPVEIESADRAALRRWFVGRLDRPAPIPDLAGAGFRLLGGRVISGASGPVEFVVYEGVKGERVGLAIEALDAPAVTAVGVSESAGLQRAAWRDAGYGFVALGSFSDVDIGEIALRISADGPYREARSAVE